MARDDNEAEIAREYEIRVLERDAKIDADTALCLRKNLLAHFFASDAAPREPLAELPYPIEFDEAAALKAARLQCPHFDSLSLEGQLKYLEEDLLKKRQRAATSRQHAEAVVLRAPGSKEALNARIDASMWELGPGPGAQWGIVYQITELKEKIAERDRSLRPSQKETSPTA